MPKTIAEQTSYFQTLVTSYEALLNEGKSETEFSDEEQKKLDRISTKLDEVRKRLDAANPLPENTANSENAAAPGKAGRLGKLRDMQSSIAGLMASLKSAR